MAKYTVKHTCGHEQEYQLFGKHSERERRLEWLATQDCPNCRRAAEEKKNAEAIAGSPFAEIENTVLSGSEKQIAWAQNIRKAFLAELAGINVGKYTSAIIKFFAEQTAAKFWVDDVHGRTAKGVLLLHSAEIQAIYDAQNA